MMTTLTPSLEASKAPLDQVLAVLDLADQVRAEQRPSSEETSSALLTVVQGLQTDHTLSELEEAVVRHQQALKAPAGSPSPSYTFGWRRPKTLAAYRHQTETGWRARLARLVDGSEYAQGVKKIARWSVPLIGLGIGVGMVLSVGWAGLTMWMWTLMIMGAVLGGGLVLKALQMLADKCWHQVHQLQPMALSDYHLGEYLKHPTTRAYLKAIMRSSVPHVLHRDAKALNALHKSAIWKIAADREEAELQAQLKIQQQQLQALLT